MERPGSPWSVDRLVETFDFEQINEAAAKAHDGEVIKPVLEVG